MHLRVAHPHTTNSLYYTAFFFFLLHPPRAPSSFVPFFPFPFDSALGAPYPPRLCWFGLVLSCFPSPSAPSILSFTLDRLARAIERLPYPVALPPSKSPFPSLRFASWAGPNYQRHYNAKQPQLA